MVLVPVAAKLIDGKVIRLFVRIDGQEPPLIIVLSGLDWTPVTNGWSDASILDIAVAKHGFVPIDNSTGFLYKDRQAAIQNIEAVFQI